MANARTQPSSCPICGCDAGQLEFAAASLQVRWCAGCGHRVARHNSGNKTSDYYEHTPQTAQFLSSLEYTRRRQARLVLSRFVKHHEISDWLDLGSGRGWFLEEARSRATGPIGGFDSSSLSRRWLRERSILAAEPRQDDPLWPDWASLPFSPRVVSLLDVIEHLAERGAERLLQRLRAELPTLEWVVLKVPASEGILYRTARALRHAFAGPYLQLYQVGTSPPHHHYFSHQSLRALVSNAGCSVVELMVDHDVDNIFHRIESLAWLPGGTLPTRLIHLGPADSVIVFAKVGSHAARGEGSTRCECIPGPSTRP